MFSPEVKDWVSVLAPSLSVLAAITALGLSARLAYAQRRIQEIQLQERLFDRRYAVFVAVREFLDYIFKNEGSVSLLSEEFRRFRDVRQQAEFLFKADVTNYMEALNKAADALYVKCRERDHLAKMNRNDNALDVQVTQMMIELETQFAQKRKEVFSEYLHVSLPTTVERSPTQMRLNGWHRLWVLVSILWLLPVILFSYTGWPTTAQISKGDVYFRMKPDDTHRLTDYYDVMASSFGGTNVVSPRIAELQKDKAFLAASPKEQKAYLSYADPDFAKASPLDQNAYLGNITGIKGPTVDIDGHSVQFVQAVPQEEMNQTAREYHAVLRQILSHKRAAFVGEALAMWMIPAIGLYGLGWGILWVRRGFGTPAT